MRLQNICAQWTTGNLEAVLCRALHDEPHFRYILPDQQSRLRLLPGLVRAAIHASQLHGEIYTTQNINGGALWIGPGNGLTIGHMMRKGFPSALPQWGRANLRRSIKLGLRLDEVHQRSVNGRHWYLLALGMEPSEESEGVRATLIEPLLSRADSDGLPCYLETFNERSLPFFERHGFRIAGGGKISRSGPDFWAMIRAPQEDRNVKREG